MQPLSFLFNWNFSHQKYPLFLTFQRKFYLFLIEEGAFFCYYINLWNRCNLNTSVGYLNNTCFWMLALQPTKMSNGATVQGNKRSNSTMKIIRQWSYILKYKYFLALFYVWNLSNNTLNVNKNNFKPHRYRINFFLNIWGHNCNIKLLFWSKNDITVNKILQPLEDSNWRCL